MISWDRVVCYFVIYIVIIIHSAHKGHSYGMGNHQNLQGVNTFQIISHVDHCSRKSCGDFRRP